MAKYSDEFKLMIVREYQNGPLGFKLLVRKYEIKSPTQLKNWVNIYKNQGAVGLSRKKTNEVYSVQFKLDVLSFMKRTGASYTETALHFGLTNPSMIASWKGKLFEGGVEGLLKPKGRPAMSDKAKNSQRRKQPVKEMTVEQKLKRENELLRLENEYLKKLRAFQMDPDGYLEKHKQRYHMNSKKNSD